LMEMFTRYVLLKKIKSLWYLAIFVIE